MTDNNQKNNRKKSGSFFRDLQIEFLIHELKDPLAVVETGLRTLLERKDRFGELNPRQEKTMKRALRNTKKAREMLYGLLEIGQAEAECFHFNAFRPAGVLFEVLLQVLETAAWDLHERCSGLSGEEEILCFLSENGIHLRIDPDAGDREIRSDESKVRGIMGNLLKNAFHYRKKSVEVTCGFTENTIRVNVKDDGPGIDEQYHELIFQRYAQVKKSEAAIFERKGHGLGLAGARILARKLGGDIEVQSHKGEGTSFQLILPVTGECDTASIR